MQKDDHNSRLTCTSKADETKSLRMEGIEPRIHENHIARKSDNSLHHYKLVHKFIPMLHDENASSEKSSVQIIGKT